MSKQYTWPSRQLQITIIIVLVAAALIRAFMPPLTREGRAEKLYIDSWYAGLNLTSMLNPDSSEKAVKMLEKAIELQPGNSMYEQALVWRYPKDKLPELLYQRSMGKEARRLAAGLIYENVEKETTGDKLIESFKAIPSNKIVDNRERLRRLDTLVASDPDNALPRYMRALVYSDLDRPADMLADVKTANRMDLIRSYKPDIPDEIADSIAGTMLITDFENYAKYRELARRLADYGNRQLRSGNSDGAVKTLEECCLMGVRMTSREPINQISYLVSNAIFSIGWASLEPVYKDLGMEDKLRQYQRVEDAYGKFTDESRDAISNTDFSLITRAFIFTGFTAYAVGYSLAGLLLALIGWAIMAQVRMMKNQDILNIPVWNEGWLARFFMAVYTPVAILSGLALVSKPILNFLFGGIGSILIIASYLLALIITTLIVLRQRYIEHMGERIGFWRFVFKVPSSVRAWRDRAFAAMFAGQLLFLLCCGSVITLFYKSAYGAHPWQPMRIQYGIMSEEKAMVSRFSSELNRLAHTDNRGTKSYR